jgi:hypothetical protein
MLGKGSGAAGGYPFSVPWLLPGPWSWVSPQEPQAALVAEQRGKVTQRTEQRSLSHMGQPLCLLEC